MASYVATDFFAAGGVPVGNPQDNWMKVLTGGFVAICVAIVASTSIPAMITRKWDFAKYANTKHLARIVGVVKAGWDLLVEWLNRATGYKWFTRAQSDTVDQGLDLVATFVGSEPMRRLFGAKGE